MTSGRKLPAEEVWLSYDAYLRVTLVAWNDFIHKPDPVASAKELAHNLMSDPFAFIMQARVDWARVPPPSFGAYLVTSENIHTQMPACGSSFYRHRYVFREGVPRPRAGDLVRCDFCGQMYEYES